MLLINAAYPRPATQIPVLGADGYPRYYLDMGWEGIKIAVEYDREHQRENQAAYRKDIIRLKYLAGHDWIVVRVVNGQNKNQILARVERAVL